MAAEGYGLLETSRSSATIYRWCDRFGWSSASAKANYEMTTTRETAMRPLATSAPNR
jgi:hypothetical protein